MNEILELLQVMNELSLMEGRLFENLVEEGVSEDWLYWLFF